MSDTARRHNYHYSHALRWIRFLHLVALKAEGFPTDRTLWPLGFSDPGGVTRFVKALHGRTLSELPPDPLRRWVPRGIVDVFLGGAGS